MLNIRLTSPTNPVKAEVITTSDLPTAPRTTPPLPTEDLGVCTECSGDLDTLTGNKGEIRAVFCPYCEFSY
ncbi:hypothetical protein [Streptomyces sp. NPDC012616]|uniref:hypothetical protein n=1 Tax=Streptomyces sp. NPDC012616 TaxID=3364840 RepID=UPI0036ECBE20